MTEYLDYAEESILKLLAEMKTEFPKGITMNKLFELARERGIVSDKVQLKRRLEKLLNSNLIEREISGQRHYYRLTKTGERYVALFNLLTLIQKVLEIIKPYYEYLADPEKQRIIVQVLRAYGIEISEEKLKEQMEMYKAMKNEICNLILPSVISFTTKALIIFMGIREKPLAREFIYKVFLVLSEIVAMYECFRQLNEFADKSSAKIEDFWKNIEVLLTKTSGQPINIERLGFEVLKAIVDKEEHRKILEELTRLYKSIEEK